MLATSGVVSAIGSPTSVADSTQATAQLYYSSSQLHILSKRFVVDTLAFLLFERGQIPCSIESLKEVVLRSLRQQEVEFGNGANEQQQQQQHRQQRQQRQQLRQRSEILEPKNIKKVVQFSEHYQHICSCVQSAFVSFRKFHILKSSDPSTKANASPPLYPTFAFLFGSDITSPKETWIIRILSSSMDRDGAMAEDNAIVSQHQIQRATVLMPTDENKVMEKIFKRIFQRVFIAVSEEELGTLGATSLHTLIYHPRLVSLGSEFHPKQRFQLLSSKTAKSKSKFYSLTLNLGNDGPDAFKIEKDSQPHLSWEKNEEWMWSICSHSLKGFSEL